MTVWMEVDLDHNELPIRVCNTAQELAKECGVTPAAVMSANLRYEKGKYRSRYIKVVVDDSMDED